MWNIWSTLCTLFLSDSLLPLFLCALEQKAHKFHMYLFKFILFFQFSLFLLRFIYKMTIKYWLWKAYFPHFRFHRFFLLFLVLLFSFSTVCCWMVLLCTGVCSYAHITHSRIYTTYIHVVFSVHSVCTTGILLKINVTYLPNSKYLYAHKKFSTSRMLMHREQNTHCFRHSTTSNQNLKKINSKTHNIYMWDCWKWKICWQTKWLE